MTGARVGIAAVLVAWAAGGWLFLWVTTRRREVGLGYGWLMRGVFLTLAGGALATLGAASAGGVHRAAVWLFVCVGAAAAVVSVLCRHAGVAGQRAASQRRADRVASMTGAEASTAAEAAAQKAAAQEAQKAAAQEAQEAAAQKAQKAAAEAQAETEAAAEETEEETAEAEKAAAAEFPPLLDLAAALTGLLAAGLLAAGLPGADSLAVVRSLVGALFLGAVTDAMLLGHWYLVQPGLPRAPLLQLVRASGWLWVPETAAWLWPTGMASVLSGSISDGYNGLLGWFWVACVVATAALVATTLAALRDRRYSAVMAATGLMYLAILTAFGQDLVARILLAG